LDRGARSGDGAGLPKALRCLLRQQGDAGTLSPPLLFPLAPFPSRQDTAMNRAPRYTGPFIRGGGGLVALLSPCLLALISVTTEWVVNHLFRQQSASTVLATNR
jgi:hypothetical protein